ncbi:hypothetical protein L211DRAFT_679803 [Terfezia boudieri ATCC MYA-4762]|uniref:Uncharacterized protein n=1 Tax=Terfezia boudieri ATCC MYA-4762 TaxID=1051890 RepID=A0A3N4LXP7_9PEZI|nr:hypothetical protein L211DRAFT_679803 [Terfezia boudieri ATCC MYA-4762]
MIFGMIYDLPSMPRSISSLFQERPFTSWLSVSTSFLFQERPFTSWLSVAIVDIACCLRWLCRLRGVGERTDFSAWRIVTWVERSVVEDKWTLTRVSCDVSEFCG